MAMSENSWRAVIAALAHDRAREVYASIVLGRPADDVLAELSPGARRRALDILQKAGLVSSVDGGWRAESDVFRAALSEAPAAPRPSGVERFFSGGRLTVYPSRVSDREAVLAHIAVHLLARDETVTEKEVTRRLAGIVDDPASMRRYLVDAGLLDRRRDGSDYTRSA